jgi:hypothetical protein
MMAKMFYTLDETKVALGKSEDEVKQLAREGRLREFRDGPRLMFKADQVESLKSEMGGGGDQVDLGPSDTGAGIGLVDSKGASGTSIALVDTGGGSGMMQMKDDTALAADLGLSGSVSGVPSPGRVSPGGSAAGMSRGGSAGGISVFGADEVEKADPMAQTNISGSISDQVNLEGVGSGSGLLDLTRESDDTSLGAELLDEIAPSPGRIQPQSAETQMGGSGTMSGLGAGLGSAPAILPSSAPSRSSGPIVYQEARDSMAPAFGWASAGATLVVLFAMFILASAINGFRPGILDSLKEYSFIVLTGIGLVVAVVFFVVGLIIGKAATR